MKSLFVPVALVDAYRASGADGAAWKDVALLSSIISPADVAFYIHANVASHHQYAGALTRSFPNLLVGVLTDSGFDKLDKLVQRKLNDLSQADSGTQYQVTGEVTPTVLYIDDQLVVYTIGYSDVSDTDKPTDGWYEFVAKLHPFFRLEELSALPVFAEYLKHRPSVSST